MQEDNRLAAACIIVGQGDAVDCRLHAVLRQLVLFVAPAVSMVKRLFAISEYGVYNPLTCRGD